MRSSHIKSAEEWDINAPFYMTEVRSPFYQIVHGEKLRTFSLQTEGRLALDLGAGTGYFSDCMRQIGKKALALDFSWEMVHRGSQSYPAVVFVEGSASQLPFKDEQFDIIVANGALHHFKEQNLLEDAVHEVNRVLKEGGVFCLFDRNDSLLPRTIHHFVMFSKKLAVRLAGAFPSSSTLTEPDFGDADLQLFLDCGLEIAERTYVSSIPMFMLVVVANTLEYAFGMRVASGFRNMLAPVARWLEHRITWKGLCVEQCVKLIKRNGTASLSGKR